MTRQQAKVLDVAGSVLSRTWRRNQGPGGGAGRLRCARRRGSVDENKSHFFIGNGGARPRLLDCMPTAWQVGG